MTTSLPRRPTRTRRALASVALTACALLASGPAATAARDVEVHDGAAQDGVVRVQPGVELLRGIRGPVGWDVEFTNGTDVRVELDLAVHHLVPGDDTPDVGDEVSWALLPRGRVVLDGGEVGRLSVALSPTAPDLPAAVALVATTPGDDVRSVRATAVLWPDGHVPAVSLDLASPTVGDGPRHLLVRDDAGPSVVALRIRSTAWPAPARTFDAGPLVLLGGQVRVVEVPQRSGLLGQSVVVAAGVEGDRVAEATFGDAAEPARLAVVAVALLALAGTGALAVRHHRRA